MLVTYSARNAVSVNLVKNIASLGVIRLRQWGQQSTFLCSIGHVGIWWCSRHTSVGRADHLLRSQRFKLQTWALNYNRRPLLMQSCIFASKHKKMHKQKQVCALCKNNAKPVGIKESAMASLSIALWFCGIFKYKYYGAAHNFEHDHRLKPLQY